MKELRIKLIAIVLLAALVLSGCKDVNKGVSDASNIANNSVNSENSENQASGDNNSSLDIYDVQDNGEASENNASSTIPEMTLAPDELLSLDNIPNTSNSEGFIYTEDDTLSFEQNQARLLASLATDEDGIDNSWALWLINAKNPFPEDYAPDLTQGDGFRTDSRCAEYATLMLNAAKADGIDLNVASSYRNVELQKTNFINLYNAYLSDGNSEEDAFDLTAAEIAPPYTSEHNAALALDIGIIEDYFDQTEEYRWLRANSWKYGYIMRYPKDKESITGIIYEPWHYRFVGLYHAEKMYNSGLCLEEYMNDDGSNNDKNKVVAAFKEYVLAQ